MGSLREEELVSSFREMDALHITVSSNPQPDMEAAVDTSEWDWKTEYFALIMAEPL